MDVLLLLYIFYYPHSDLVDENFTLITTTTRGQFVALAWHVPSQRCLHRFGWKCIAFWLYQTCMYDLK